MNIINFPQKRNEKKRQQYLSRKIQNDNLINLSKLICPFKLSSNCCLFTIFYILLTLD